MLTRKGRDVGFFVFLGVFFVYMLIGAPIAKHYYRKKHGVSIRIIGGGMNAVLSGAMNLTLIWPLVLFMPHFRDPQPCTHSDHILARAQARDHAEQVQAAYDRERGSR